MKNEFFHQKSPFEDVTTVMYNHIIRVISKFIRVIHKFMPSTFDDNDFSSGCKSPTHYAEKFISVPTNFSPE